MVIVADDIALPDNKQPRGIAGTALVHKIAGYAAEQGKSLNDVRDIAQQACDNLWSPGVAMQTCNLPGSDDEGGALNKAMSSWVWAFTASRELPSWIRKTAKPLSTRW